MERLGKCSRNKVDGSFLGGGCGYRKKTSTRVSLLLKVQCGELVCKVTTLAEPPDGQKSRATKYHTAGTGTTTRGRATFALKRMDTGQAVWERNSMTYRRGS